MSDPLRPVVARIWIPECRAPPLSPLRDPDPTNHGPAPLRPQCSEGPSRIPVRCGVEGRRWPPAIRHHRTEVQADINALSDRESPIEPAHLWASRILPRAQSHRVPRTPRAIRARLVGLTGLVDLVRRTRDLDLCQLVTNLPIQVCPAQRKQSPAQRCLAEPQDHTDRWQGEQRAAGRPPSFPPRRRTPARRGTSTGPNYDGTYPPTPPSATSPWYAPSARRQ